MPVPSASEPCPSILVYDNNCGPCSDFKNAIQFLDARHRLRFMALDIAATKGYLSSVDPRYRFRSFHLVTPEDGVLSGADALPKLAESLPFGRYAAQTVFGLPLARRAVTFLYRLASRLHETGDCGVRKIPAMELRSSRA